MKIAILYICTGKYTIFWDDFFKTCEENFFRDAERHYFVFTDSIISEHNNSNIHRIEQQNLGWPGNTLMRFHMFEKIKYQLQNFDYIFFFNANCRFIAPIGSEILPTEEEGITVVQHPGFYNKTPMDFTYDRNPHSRAYIPYREGRYYVCGGINGGRVHAYLSLIDRLRRNIDSDLENNIIALWHDESHLNRYILENKYKIISPSYCYPEDWILPYQPKILIKNKEKYGGTNALRGLPPSERIEKKHFSNIPSGLRTIGNVYSLLKHRLFGAADTKKR